MLPILYAAETEALRKRVMNRSQLENDEISARVKEIVRRVREEGDKGAMSIDEMAKVIAEAQLQ